MKPSHTKALERAYVMIENVRITLTIEQIALIEKERRKRKSCRSNFKRMLKHFGFNKIKGSPNCFDHSSTNWYAEIMDFGNHEEVFIWGKDLEHDSAPPGGHMYGSPEEIEKEILRVTEKHELL